MNRRDLIKAFSLMGVAPIANLANAIDPVGDDLKSPEEFWIFAAAKGGWDPTSLCDPKGDIEFKDKKGRSKGPINKYKKTDILQYGNLKFSPYNHTVDNSLVDNTDPYKKFLQKHADNLLVINGIDTGTNSHRIGQRSVSTGSILAGLPSLPGLIAATHGKELALSFMTYGYSDHTYGIVPRSKFSGSGRELLEMTNPNRIQPNKENDQRLYHESAIVDIIMSAQDKRLQRLIDKSSLPIKKDAMMQLANARLSSQNLEKILDKLPNTLSRENRGLHAQAQTACAAFASGICASAMIQVGGFDTHNNNDAKQYEHCGNFLASIDFLLEEAERHGIQDRLNIVMLSDFSRTPFYNQSNGKDHWTTTSMMFMGPKFQGNRVIGATNDQFKPLKVNPTTLKVDDNGIILRTAHIHEALRKLAGVDSQLNERFKLPDLHSSALNLFG